MPILFSLLAIAVQAGAPASEPQEPATEKPVCRREQAVGSFLAKRVCHSKREWVAIDRSNGLDAEAALSQRRPGMPQRQ